ncbi:hypothetical protein LTS08_006351 [Lithohypha guttulata]|uniref:uncharacterized protein n=1 Tax=Lithohypha guttulata TaxID=1690604 RepID=UPI002DDF79E4|nr:hypothetical protein LTR51_000873 [Lithohypha guttulata]KAK5098218.1 hypothetical protein LTS08_006351 [Lithohypha guttulata]
MGMVGPTTFWSSYTFWTGSSIAASILLVKAAPEFTLSQSVTKTAIAIFFAQWLVYGIYAVILYPRYLSPLRHLPTVTEGSNPIMGQWFAITREASGEPMRRWTNTIENDGMIRYLGFFNRERILLTKPKALSEVLNTKNYEFQRPGLLLRGIKAILGEGLLLAEGDDHKFQRKGLAPAFAFRHIKELYPIFWSKSREMVKAMEEVELSGEKPNEAVEIGGWASRAALDIIGLGGMGQDFNSLADPNTELNNTYRKVFSPNRQAQILGLLQFFIPGWIVRALPLSRNDDIAAASKVARGTARNLIRQKKARLDQKEKMNPDIISIALESGVFTEEKLLDNMMTFLAAGHETTASSLTWVAYLLAKHPEVQSKLRDEIHEHISNLNNDVDDTIIDQMPYLHAVCQEVLRLYPPVPVTLREAVQDTSIQGQPIQKGTVIMLSPWAVNASKELWGDDADQFNPERWMGGKANSGGATSNYAALTFLHGPRSCIGQRFATAEMACLTAALVGKFDFELSYPDQTVVIKGGITARPRDGMHLKLKPVKW